MADLIPFSPSTNNERLRVPLGASFYLFDYRWNSADKAWYFDLREEDETPILIGAKLVLGAKVGRRSTHTFFQEHVLTLVETSGSNLDAGFDDLGARVVLLHMTVNEFRYGTP